ncbi:hypothetical protein HF1_03610 [Mycoplasma haemofelis str. Langford 1]|uniref:Uncharacterized protein n=1 Tax=Mycoplasma haemofelis (strain Langford 1) TaxID=941640 RepID=E8ZGU8_MYCHL|nr:hypothetical protein [Mycoplasma haemofelis]CBY92369.1 hypothetical protein HF1_03610 [Mycoplasma haemofelis str. Langford 1]
MDIKLLGAIGSAGTVAAGGGMYLALKDKTTPISELFKQEKGRVLMTDDSDAKWDAAWELYRNDHKVEGSTTYKDVDKWGISNWKDKKGESKAFKEFKDECSKRSKAQVTDTNKQEYLDVKKYCSRPKKVSELLSEDKSLTLLKKGEDAEAWNASWSKYKEAQVVSKNNNNVTYKTTDTWSMSIWNSKKTDTTAPDDYKDECGKKADSYIVPENLTEDETFKQVRSWCTK